MTRPHFRQRTRLRDFDYSAGAYFVTTVTSDRACILGGLDGDQIKLNAIGKLVESFWTDLPNRFPSISLDVFVVMPNHFHGVVILEGGDASIAPTHAMQSDPQRFQSVSEGVQSISRASPTLGEIMKAFKSLTTVHVNRLPNRSPIILWQRGYHDHIIRDDVDLTRIRDYIEFNPGLWDEDPENPRVATK